MTPARSASPFRLGLSLTLALFASGPATGASTVPMTVEATSGAGSARLRLLWPMPRTARAEIGAEAVVVSVDEEVDPQAVRDSVAMLPDWIASAAAEGRTIRLVPAPGRRVTAASLRRGIELRFAGGGTAGAAVASAMSSTQKAEVAAAEPPAEEEFAEEAPAPEEPAVAQNEGAAAERRLRLTRARLMMETGDPQGARRELEKLRSEVPNSVEIVAALAGVEAQLGGWRRAVGLFDRALELNPDDPALVRAKAELLREHGPRFRMDFDHRKVRDADRQILAKASGEALAGMSTYGFALEGNDLKAPAVRRRDGTVTAFDGRRVRGEAYVAVDHEDPGITRGSLIGGNGIVGAALRHTRPFAGGTARAVVAVQDPYWEVVDGLVNEGRTDRVLVGYERQLGTDWRVAGKLAVGRYGIKGNSGIAQFIAPGLEVAYSLIQGPPTVTLSYAVDAEYLGRRKTAIDAFGLEYPLLSVVSREVHYGTIGVSGTLRPDLRYNLFGGWAYDRLNADGSFFGGEIAWEPSVHFEIGLSAAHAIATGRGSDAPLTRLGGYLLWRF
jgi:tetratricopeptide (TPR) repeat protein